MLHGQVPSLLGIHQACSWYPSITELLKLRTPDSTPPPLFHKWAIPNLIHSTSWLHCWNPSLSTPLALLLLFSPISPARPPRCLTALLVLQPTLQNATKQISWLHSPNWKPWVTTAYSSNYPLRGRGNVNLTSVNHILWSQPFPFCCECAIKKSSREQRCGGHVRGQEPTFHSQIFFPLWVFLAHLYFGSGFLIFFFNSIWLLIIKNNPRSMSC